MVLLVQFGSRMQHMVASASSVLLDVDRRKHQLPRETSALRKAMEVGQTRPLECLLHRMRCGAATYQPQPMPCFLSTLTFAATSRPFPLWPSDIALSSMSDGGIFMPSKDISLALWMQYASRGAGILRVCYEERPCSCRCAASCLPVWLQCIHGTCVTCRWEKSSAEAGLMQASASATAAAMTECMQLTRPGVQEHQLAAVFGEHQLANLPFACLQLRCWCNWQQP